MKKLIALVLSLLAVASLVAGWQLGQRHNRKQRRKVRHFLPALFPCQP